MRNPYVRHTSTLKKMKGAAILRKINGLQLNNGRPPVCYLHQPFRCAEIRVGKNGLHHICTTQVCTDQVGSAQVGSVQTGTAQIGTAQVSAEQMSKVQTGTAQIGTIQIGTA